MKCIINKGDETIGEGYLKVIDDSIVAIGGLFSSNENDQISGFSSKPLPWQRDLEY